MAEEQQITVEISIKDIVYMLEHYDELGDIGKAWVDIFKGLWKEYLEKDST